MVSCSDTDSIGRNIEHKMRPRLKKNNYKEYRQYIVVNTNLVMELK